MAKDKLYNQLLEKVHQKGGFVKFEAKTRPFVYLTDEKRNTKGTIVAALFVSDDESSPLKFITNRFTAFDVDDYLNAEDIEHLLSRI
jgi:hypothetical protein